MARILHSWEFWTTKKKPRYTPWDLGAWARRPYVQQTIIPQTVIVTIILVMAIYSDLSQRSDGSVTNRIAENVSRGGDWPGNAVSVIPWSFFHEVNSQHKNQSTNSHNGYWNSPGVCVSYQIKSRKNAKQCNARSKKAMGPAPTTQANSSDSEEEPRNTIASTNAIKFAHPSQSPFLSIFSQVK